MPSRKCLAAAGVLVLFFAALNHSAPAAIFSPGEFITYGQDDWGTIGTPASDLLLLHFFDVSPNGVAIGIVGAAGNSAVFSTPEASLVYLPATGPPFPLDNDYSDPTSTEAGIFGGHMLALQLDVDFSDAGYLLGPSGIPFGDLILFDMQLGATDLTGLNGQTVRQFLELANSVLGGGSSPFAVDDISNVAFLLTVAFQGGLPSQFAQDHLRIASAPGVVPELASVFVWAGLALLAMPRLVHRTRRSGF
jgi:hypothetical protein